MEEPKGCVSWHPGWRSHRYRGRVLAQYILLAARAALETLQSRTELGEVPLNGNTWHMTGVYDDVREKMRLEPASWRSDELRKCIFGLLLSCAGTSVHNTSVANFDAVSNAVYTSSHATRYARCRLNPQDCPLIAWWIFDSHKDPDRTLLNQPEKGSGRICSMSRKGVTGNTPAANTLVSRLVGVRAPKLKEELYTGPDEYMLDSDIVEVGEIDVVSVASGYDGVGRGGVGSGGKVKKLPAGGVGARRTKDQVSL